MTEISHQSVCHLLNKDMQAQVGTFSVLHSRTKAGRSTRSKISWLLSSALTHVAEYMSKCHATKAVPDVGKMFQHYLWLGVVLHLPSSAPFPPLQLSHLHFSLVLWLALSFLSPSTLSFFFPLNHSFRFSRKYFFFLLFYFFLPLSHLYSFSCRAVLLLSFLPKAVPNLVLTTLWSFPTCSFSLSFRRLHKSSVLLLSFLVSSAVHPPSFPSESSPLLWHSPLYYMSAFKTP